MVRPSLASCARCRGKVSRLRGDIHWPLVIQRTQRLSRAYSFVSLGPSRGNGIEAVVVACMTPEPLGHDNTFFLLEKVEGMSRATVHHLISEVDLDNAVYKDFHIVGKYIPSI